jgi:hypothetical protein
MSTVEQKALIRQSRDSAELPYIVTGAASATAARTLALGAAPDTIEELEAIDAEAQEIEGVDGTYEVRVRYALPNAATAPEDTISDSFEVAVSPVPVLQSRSTISFWPDVEATPRFNGAINVDVEGHVGGVEWPPSTPQVFSRSAVVEASRITETYYRTMSALVGRVNAAAFMGFEASEVLFLGASGSRRGIDADDPWEITWKFAVSLNAVDIHVGPDITVDAKAGWDYLWVYYRPTTDADAKMLIPRPRSAYVERIAQDGDFGDLNPPPPPDP